MQNKDKMKTILVIAGPSASGKTTVAKKITELSESFELARSVTSRPPRGDGHDAEYIYLDDAKFESAKSSGELLEYTNYASSNYGTPKSEIERIIAAGKTPLLVLDLNGVRALVSSPELSACAVYLYDDIRVIDERLYNRYLSPMPTVEGLTKYVKRKEQNIADYLECGSFAPDFYAFLRNNLSPEETAKAVMAKFDEYINGAPRGDAEISGVVDILVFNAKTSSGENL